MKNIIVSTFHGQVNLRRFEQCIIWTTLLSSLVPGNSNFSHWNILIALHFDVMFIRSILYSRFYLFFIRFVVWCSKSTLVEYTHLYRFCLCFWDLYLHARDVCNIVKLESNVCSRACFECDNYNFNWTGIYHSHAIYSQKGHTTLWLYRRI